MWLLRFWMSTSVDPFMLTILPVSSPSPWTSLASTVNWDRSSTKPELEKNRDELRDLELKVDELDNTD